MLSTKSAYEQELIIDGLISWLNNKHAGSKRESKNFPGRYVGRTEDILQRRNGYGTFHFFVTKSLCISPHDAIDAEYIFLSRTREEREIEVKSCDRAV